MSNFWVLESKEIQVNPNIYITCGQVILENTDGLPHLVYVSREKRPEYPHDYKAGAMNVLVILIFN